jgi:hypothetical protein
LTVCHGGGTDSGGRDGGVCLERFRSGVGVPRSISCSIWGGWWKAMEGDGRWWTAMEGDGR